MTKRGVIEEKLLNHGLRIFGVDEVGRGCIAGPVFAACAAINFTKLKKLNSDKKKLIRDSKTLSKLQRKKVIEFLPEYLDESHFGVASVREIEQYGILEATFLAMRRCFEKCQASYDLLLIDGNQNVTGYSGEQMTIVGGDNLCFSIAAASIIAKEKRDEFMRKQAELYPGYGFEDHVGYGTKRHLSALGEKGPCSLHRNNFAPVAKLLPPSPLFVQKLPIDEIGISVGRPARIAANQFSENKGGKY